MTAVLECALAPHQDMNFYKSTMLDIFALMCFLEGSHGIGMVNQPFVNINGDPISVYARSSDLYGLSETGKRALHKQQLNCLLPPTEEMFFCLIMGKYVLEKLQERNAPIPDFFVKGTITAYQKTGSVAYSGEYIAFFYKQMNVVMASYEAEKKKPKHERTLVFDYPEQAVAINLQPVVPADATILPAVKPETNDIHDVSADVPEYSFGEL